MLMIRQVVVPLNGRVSAPRMVYASIDTDQEKIGSGTTLMKTSARRGTVNYFVTVLLQPDRLS